MNDEYILRVSQLNEYVSGMLGRETLLQHIGVRGEISGFKRHTSGHLYFSLKDEKALIRCVMFRQSAALLRSALQDGMQVVARGRVSLYVRDGQYQLYVESVQSEGEGDLYRQFLLCKARLEEKGYFDPAHKKPLPFLPRAVGVVTSRTGAVLQDILSVTRRRFPNMPVILYAVRVQGAGAAEEIARGIRYMNEHDLADVLIVGRGGGSMEDLWAFNEECVARAIYESRIPVVSAVGHETDFSIADFTADLRAPTPSAAAELCVPEHAILRGEAEGVRAALQNSLQMGLDSRRARVKALRDSAGFAQPGFALRSAREGLYQTRSAMKNAMRALLAAAEDAQAGLSGRLQALSPVHVLSRGYALIHTGEGYAGRVAALHREQDVKIIMQDGWADATIREIMKGTEHE